MGVGISLSRLASAVANEGGIGVIASAGIGMREPDFFSNFQEANLRALRREVSDARALTKGIIGMNIMVAFTNFGELVETAIDAGIDIIFSGAGLPLNLPKYRTANSKTKLVPIVSSGRAAALICNHWLKKHDYLPDALVVEGPKAGGHLGFKRSQISRCARSRRPQGRRAPGVQEKPDIRSRLRTRKINCRCHNRGSQVRNSYRQEDPGHRGWRYLHRRRYQEIHRSGCRWRTDGDPFCGYP